MSDLGNVLCYYEMGEEAEAKGDFFNAAKYFRQSYFYTIDRLKSNFAGIYF